VAEPSAGPVRVFLVDDHEVVRRGVAEVLEDDAGITVAGEAGQQQVVWQSGRKRASPMRYVCLRSWTAT